MGLDSTFFRVILSTIILFVSIGVVSQSLEKEIDQHLESIYLSDQPGTSVIVTKNGQPIYRKSFGMANLELDVKMKPEHVFEIGSITKQFTAVSILMLMEQGKLSLQDEITKYLPDYPTHGHSITIHHLLNHTSGIKSYTSMSNFQSQTRTDLMPLELIDVFKDEPMDFDPGEKYLYNNSAYIILGHIIEHISGETYEDFVEINLFKPAGMTSSCYGHHSEIIKNRASGYQPDQSGYVNADYLSMTLPYAGGSLMSNVDDLARWQEAINDNKYISESSKQLAWSNYTLNNGKEINYGYGWGPNDINGTSSIEHGGGIFGFTTMGIYIPEHDVYVAVLTNSNGTNPTEIAAKIAASVIGQPYPSETSIVQLNSAQLEKWTGAYEFEDGSIRFVSVDDGQLYSQRKDGNSFKIFPSSENNFFFDGGMISYEFENSSNGKIAKFKNRIVQSIGKEVELEIPKPKKEIALPSAVLMQYEGQYELQPKFIIEVTIKDEKIYAQATGQPQFEIFAEREDNFFLKVVPASIVFSKNSEGEVTSLTLHQNGMQMPGKKL